MVINRTVLPSPTEIQRRNCPARRFCSVRVVKSLSRLAGALFIRSLTRAIAVATRGSEGKAARVAVKGVKALLNVAKTATRGSCREAGAAIGDLDAQLACRGIRRDADGDAGVGR